MDFSRPSLTPLRGFLVFLAALCAAFPLGLNRVSGADPGFHLAVGRWMAEHWVVPWCDVLAPGLATHAYIDQSWLYQLLYFFVCEAAGFDGISILHALLYFFAALIFAVRIRRLPAGWATTGLMLYAVWWSAAWRMAPRPESVSWVLFGLSLLLLEENRRGRKNALPWLVPIAVIWANCHATFPLLWLACLSHLVGAILAHRKWNSSVQKLAVWSLITLLASLLNPYGWRLWGQIAGVVNRAHTQPIFAESIPELSNPWTLAFQDPWSCLTRPDLLGFGIATAVYAVLATARYRTRWSWSGFLMTALFWAVAATSVRMIPYFLFVAVPEIVRLAATGERMVNHTTGALLRRRVLCGMGIFLLLMESVRTVNGARSWSSGQHFGIGLNNATTYSAVGKFLKSKHLTHLRLLNDPNSGGWLAWWTQMPIFSHGNMEILGSDFYARLLRSNGAEGPGEFIEQLRPEVVVADIGFGANWVQFLENDPRWRRVFWDGNAIVYLPTDFAEAQSPPLEKAPLGMILPAQRVNNAAELQLLQSRSAIGLRRYYFGAPTSITPQSAEFAYRLDDFATAERLLLATLREQEPSMHLAGLLVALADCYDELGDGMRAQICLARAYQLAPHNRAVAQRIRVVEKVMIKRKLVPEGWAK